jgi:hypothetical protein
LLDPVTLAANVCVPPAGTLANFGEMVTEIAGGGALEIAGGGAPALPPPQAVVPAINPKINAVQSSLFTVSFP